MKKFFHKFNSGVELLIGLFVLVATGILFYNVIMRYVFNQSTVWAEEVIRYAMIWITFIGAALNFFRGKHFGVDLILRVKSKPFVRVMKCFISLCALVFSVFVLFYGTKLVQFTIASGQITPALRLPLWIIYLVIPIGGLLSVIYLVTNLSAQIRDKKTPYEEEEEETEAQSQGEVPQ